MRWLEDNDEGLRYRVKNGLLGKTFWCTNERSCYAWRPVRPTDLQPPVFIQARFHRMKALVDRWFSYQHHLGEDPRGQWTRPAGDATRQEAGPPEPNEVPQMGTILWWPIGPNGYSIEEANLNARSLRSSIGTSRLGPEWALLAGI